MEIVAYQNIVTIPVVLLLLWKRNGNCRLSKHSYSSGGSSAAMETK
jgi:hypothetical protein